MKNRSLSRRLGMESLETRVTMDAAAVVSLPEPPAPVAEHEVGHILGFRHEHTTAATAIHKVTDVTLKRGVVGAAEGTNFFSGRLLTDADLTRE